MSNHLCHAVDCEEKVIPSLLMCMRHWRMVEKTLQLKVWAEYKEGQEITKTPSRAYLKAAQAAIDFVFEREHKQTAKATTQENTEVKLELGVMAGADSKAFLVNLTKQIDRLEKLAPLLGKGKKAAAEEEEEEQSTASEETEEEEEDAPKKKSKKAAAEEEEEEEDAPKKKAKKSKLTEDDVNAACKAAAKALIKSEGMEGPEARAKVVKVLKREFGVVSVSDLEETDYESAIETIEGIAG